MHAHRFADGVLLFGDVVMILATGGCQGPSWLWSDQLGWVWQFLQTWQDWGDVL
jgi:hypothetical protein